eukprot:5085212-Pyramimonas_sp.AAC.1
MAVIQGGVVEAIAASRHVKLKFEQKSWTKSATIWKARSRERNKRLTESVQRAQDLPPLQQSVRFSVWQMISNFAKHPSLARAFTI